MTEDLRGPYSFDQMFDMLVEHVCRVGWVDGRMLLAKDFFGFLTVVSQDIHLASFFLGAEVWLGKQGWLDQGYMVIHSNGCKLTFPVQSPTS